MDSTIVGVIIGSGLSLFGNVINQFFTSRKEQKQWENQQASEKTTWVRNEQQKEKEYLRSIYQNSLRSLSAFLALEVDKDDESSKQKKLELKNEIHKWVAMLLLRHSSPDLDKAVNSLNDWPEDHNAARLRSEIIKLSNKEEGFFLNDLKIKSEDIKENVDPDIRTITIDIDNDFRKKQLIEGIEIPKTYTFQFKLSEMSNSQREILTDIFFKKHGTIPSKLHLYLPGIQNCKSQMEMLKEQWQASINPKNTDNEFILSAWEKDFKKSDQEIKQSVEALPKDKMA